MVERRDVVVVGGGPVGLLLGCLLRARGVDVVVLERAAQPSEHSRAIGIHPPGLRCLARIGADRELVASGVRVQKGFAMSGQNVLGTIGFEVLPAPYPFVLCVPQSITERALEARLVAGAADVLRRNVEVEDVAPEADGVRLAVSTPHGPAALEATYVVGCDGKHSRVRRALGIGFDGGRYGDRFVMGDAFDRTSFGDAAAIYIAADGLIESFPLPERLRRWVARVPDDVEASAPAELVAELVARRTGHQLAASSFTMASAFAAERFVARRFVAGHVVLAGDAAHIVSPIGGQGMNLGWLDAQHLADGLTRCLAAPGDAPGELARYEAARRRSARAAQRRSELFMALGRPHVAALRRAATRLLLSPPVAPAAARMFTMRGL